MNSFNGEEKYKNKFEDEKYSKNKPVTASFHFTLVRKDMTEEEKILLREEIEHFREEQKRLGIDLIYFLDDKREDIKHYISKNKEDK